MNEKLRRKRKYTNEDLDKLADHILKYVESTDFPLVVDCELELDVYDGELADISGRYKDHNKFCIAYSKLEKKQKHFLIKNGLLKQHDSSLTKFCLSACHGMTEKQHIIQESVESCIEADEDEVEKAEEFERKRKVEV